jgi:hypothetical protein
VAERERHAGGSGTTKPCDWQLKIEQMTFQMIMMGCGQAIHAIDVARAIPFLPVVINVAAGL